MNKSYLPLLLLVVFLALGGFIYFFFFSNTAQLSGTIVFTALKPDPGDQGSLVVKYRKYQSESAYTPTGVVVNLKDNAPWRWDKAKSGEIYEMVAELEIDGKMIKQSEPVIVTAPAQNLTLPIRVTWKDLPQSVIDQADADMKGKVTINGYIPANSTLTISAKEKSQPEFQAVSAVASPQPLNEWEWKESLPLKDYTVKAVLLSDGKEIGVSPEIPAIGGDTAISLTINTTSKPATPTPVPNTDTSKPTPTPAAKTDEISGTVTINGPRAKKSSLLILYRTPGKGDYSVITRINLPQNNQSFVWDDAVIGKQYEISAALQVNEQNTATAQSVTVTAPAKNVALTINSGVIIDTPSEKPQLEACNKVNDNEFDATIRWPIVSQAENYWFQFGRNPGSSELRNDKVSAGNNNQNLRTTNRVDKGRDYYVRYAYSSCENCTSDNTFSNFSEPMKVTCN